MFASRAVSPARGSASASSQHNSGGRERPVRARSPFDYGRTGAIAAVERKVLLERADAARKLTSRRREALADVEADEGEVEEVVGD
jgi:hypothetical protein